MLFYKYDQFVLSLTCVYMTIMKFEDEKMISDFNKILGSIDFDKVTEIKNR